MFNSSQLENSAIRSERMSLRNNEHCTGVTTLSPSTQSVIPGGVVGQQQECMEAPQDEDDPTDDDSASCRLEADKYVADLSPLSTSAAVSAD